MPNLIEVQKDSYQWFLKEGLKEVFDDISPIADYSGSLSLEFVDFKLCEDDVKYSIEECKERDANYAAPLKVKVRLYNKEKEEISEHEIFMGDLPLMTATGTFIINGAERVIVSQLVRSPGIYYGIGHDKIGKRLFSCTVIPNRGAWLEYETDSNDVFYVRVDRTRKVPITVLIRAMGIGTNEEIREVFGDEPKIEASFAKDTAENYQEGLLELYKKIRPGEPLSVESAESLITAMFFDPRRYDLAKVGRYKFNKKLALRNRIRHQILAADAVDPSTGEVIAAAGTKVTAEIADSIQNAAIPFVYVQTEERNVKVLSNMMVDITSFVDCNPRELGVTEWVYYPVLEEILKEFGEDPGKLAEAIKKNVHELIPKHITKEDIFASINYNMHLEYGLGNDDDIDHLGNRRIRAVGELLQNQYRIGLSRMERVVRERMTTHDAEDISPQSLINIKPVTAAVKEFFGLSLGRHLAHQNIACAHFRADSDNSPVVQILQSIIAHAGHIPGDLLGPQLGIPGFCLVFFNMDGGIHIFHHQSLAEQNGILVVVTFPGHKADQRVLAQCQFAFIGGRTVGDHLSRLHMIPFKHNGFLIVAVGLVAAGELGKAELRLLAVIKSHFNQVG